MRDLLGQQRARAHADLQDVTQSALAGAPAAAGGSTQAAGAAATALSALDEAVLSWISYIGCSVSIVSLVLIIVVYLVLKCAAPSTRSFTYSYILDAHSSLLV